MFRISAILFVIISLCGIMPAQAQFGGAVWEVITSDSMQHTLGQKPISATPAGLHLTYSQSRGSGNGWIIYYRFFDYAGGWGSPIIVESNLPAFEPSIAAREFGAFNIGLFYDAGGDIYGDIVSSPWDSWDPVNLTNSQNLDYSVTTAIDDNGFAHLSWVTQVNNEYKIAYGILRDSAFEMEILENSQIGNFGLGAGPFVVVIDSLPHLFYRGVNSSSYNVHYAHKEHPDSLWAIEFLSTPNLDDYQASAVIDGSSDIHIAISGNGGWGMPGKIYYMNRDFQSGIWSVPELATGSNSAVDGHIGITENEVLFIASAGVSGNIYTGEIFLSNNSAGNFQTELLANFQDGISPAVAFLPGPVGAIILQGRISHPGYDNMEIIYYGPEQTVVEINEALPRSEYLSWNYPNPFNSGTAIVVNGDLKGNARLGIFNLLGRKVAEISPVETKTGELKYFWDGDNDKGITCPSGPYFYTVIGIERQIRGRMLYLK